MNAGGAGRLWGPPPWLWLTLGLALLQTWGMVDWVLWYRQEDFPETFGLLTVLAMSLVLAAPSLVLLAGALALLAPGARARRVERRYGLLAPERVADLTTDPGPGPGTGPGPGPGTGPGLSPGLNPRPSPDPGHTSAPDLSPHPHPHPADLPHHPLTEMRAFLAAHAPRAELRISLLRGMPARVYPGGPRTSRVAVFRPLVELWVRDRAAAEAILLHEVGHLGHGEQHVAGLGSPLIGLVKAWPYLFAGFGLLPAALLVASGTLPAGPLTAQVVLMLLAVPQLLLTLVGALWAAELTADRYAVRALGEDIWLRALKALDEPPRSRSAHLYHPPPRLRRWFTAHSRRTGAQVLLMLLWPVAVLVESLLDLLGAVVGYRLLGETPAEATRTALALLHDTLVTGPTWWGMLVLIALWPLFAGRWSRLMGRGGPTATGTFPPRVYATALLLPALLLLLGLLTVRPTPPPLPTTATGPTASASASVPAPAGGGTLPSPCPTPSRPAPPEPPEGLPAFPTPPGADPGQAAPGTTRTFRPLRATAVQPLAGTRAQAARDTADRLLRLRWTLTPDGTLTTTDPDLPALRTTAAYGEVRLLRGERTRTTEVSATTSWMEARLTLPGEEGGTARLDLVRAAIGVTHAVVACQVFDSTVTTAARLTLELEER
ncbi:M48 family metalloprotease [Streptomyces sp. NPDC004610]|uniref:M48 family metalloprotease n=1 Tax=unclassified Streptomyces TaxID=2593676 RepID=UPI0033B1EE3C